MTVRNPATHRGMVLTEQEAFEHLTVLSLLQRFVDRCDVLPRCGRSRLPRGNPPALTGLWRPGASPSSSGC